MRWVQLSERTQVFVLRRLLLCLLTSSLVACSGENPTCPQGTVGCPCYGNQTCDDKLDCTGGTCQQATCSTGSENCECTQGGGCDPGLVCQNKQVGDRCVDPGCPAGTQDCPCDQAERCDEGLICRDGNCQPLGCELGSTGCLCDQNDACLADDAFCNQDGWCRLVTCPAGYEGCACAQGDACGVNSRGEVLSCQEGLCVAASCLPGTQGCVCKNGNACDLPTDRCQDGFCQPDGCVPGELHCSCLAMGCRNGFACRDSAICVDNSGYPNGPCFADGRCHRGSRCLYELCQPCLLGSLNCACGVQNECNPGLDCMGGLCVESSDPDVPDQLECYTPCEQDLVSADGTYRPCPANGLMRGCVGSLVCVEGSCTEPWGTPTTCAEAIDCPHFQTCIAGQCYAQCDTDAQCPAGLSCKDHVCRVPCMVNTNDCGEAKTCVTDDGNFGHCFENPDFTGDPQQEVHGVFELSKSVLAFSNLRTSETFKIVNKGPIFETFVVRKRSHIGYFEDGTSERKYDSPDDGQDCDPAKDCPLFWLELGTQGNTTRVQRFEIGVEAGGEAVIQVAGAGGYSGVRWDGRLEVAHPHYGVQTLSIGYAERPEGRWAGNIYYFAQFGDWKLRDWQADPRAAAGAEAAPVRKFGTGSCADHDVLDGS